MKYLTSLPKRYLGRDIQSSDGIEVAELDAAEKRLGVLLPSSLREYYRALGRCKELNEAHNELLAPQHLEIIDDHLVFMHENQGVASWGFRLAEIDTPNPIVFQYSPGGKEWFSEEKNLLELLESMFSWYQELGLWPRE